VTSYFKEEQSKTVFLEGQNHFATYISVGMFHFNKCHCNEMGGVVQRTRDACLDQPVKYGVAEQYKDSITSNSTVHMC
jgi:hypothetical protein